MAIRVVKLLACCIELILPVFSSLLICHGTWQTMFVKSVVGVRCRADVDDGRDIDGGGFAYCCSHGGNVECRCELSLECSVIIMWRAELTAIDTLYVESINLCEAESMRRRQELRHITPVA